MSECPHFNVTHYLDRERFLHLHSGREEMNSIRSPSRSKADYLIDEDPEVLRENNEQLASLQAGVEVIEERAELGDELFEHDGAVCGVLDAEREGVAWVPRE